MHLSTPVTDVLREKKREQSGIHWKVFNDQAFIISRLLLSLWGQSDFSSTSFWRTSSLIKKYSHTEYGCVRQQVGAADVSIAASRRESSPAHPATHPATRTTKSCKVHYFSSPASRCLASSARHAERNISLERALAWWTHALASLINRRPSNGYSRASVWCATEVLLASRLSGPIIQPETDTRRAVKLMRAVQNHQVWIHLGT